MEPPNTPSYPPPHAPGPNTNPASPWWHDRTKVTLIASIGAMAAVLMILLFILNARGGEAAVATATPTPTTSVSVPSTEPSATPSVAVPSSSAEPSSSSDPIATPSASVEPSGPPQAELTQGWARINTGLNLRNGPGEDYAVVLKLEPREVVWVDSGPYREEDADDDLDWYSVQTINGKYGLVASGTPDEPHATNISNQFTFKSCGAPQLAGNDGLVNGLRTGRLNERERASFVLAKATGTSACLRFSNENYDPTVTLHLEVHACGAPSWDGSVMRLQPTTAGNVDAAWRVASTVDIPSALLTYGQTADADGLTNRQKILILGSRVSSPFGCVATEVTRRDTDPARTSLAADTSGCLVVLSRELRSITFAPPGGDPVTLAKNRYSLATMPLNDSATTRLVQTNRALSSQILGDC